MPAVKEAPVSSVRSVVARCAQPSVECKWDSNEKAYLCRYYGLPFESSLAYIEKSGKDCIIRAWVEVFDEALDSELHEICAHMPAKLAGDGEEVAKRLLLELRKKEW